jgi:hypothetical protein
VVAVGTAIADGLAGVAVALVRSDAGLAELGALTGASGTAGGLTVTAGGLTVTAGGLIAWRGAVAVGEPGAAQPVSPASRAHPPAIAVAASDARTGRITVEWVMASLDRCEYR